MPRTPALPAAPAAVIGAALFLGACRDSSGPDGRRSAATPIVGTFALETVDGRALPAAVQLMFSTGADFTVHSGGAQFGPGGLPGAAEWVSLSVSGETPENPGVALGSTTSYSQPVADSIVTIEGAGRLRGDTLVFRTAAFSMFGAHEWRYARVASP